MKTISEADYIVNLAPMECTASCILTYLKRKGRDLRFFLLHYWNLNYFQKVILSGKSLKNSKLNEIYGIIHTYHRGHSLEILQLMRQQKEIILLCEPERLPYFPRTNIIYESSIFKHAILIHSADENGDFHFIDPTEEYFGKMSFADLEKLANQGLFYFYSLEERKSRIYSREESIHFSINSVYKIFMSSKSSHGLEAFNVFLHDFKQLPTWDQKPREKWILQNNITISAIIKTRKNVWNAYRELGIFSDGQTEELDILVRRILNQWMFLNFSLLKYKKNPSDQLQSAILKSILEIKEKETLFVSKLKQFGDENA